VWLVVGFCLHIPIVQKEVVVVVIFVFHDKAGAARITPVLLVPGFGGIRFVVSFVRVVRDEALEGDTGGALFHASLRMPKVGADHRVVAAATDRVVVIGGVVLWVGGVNRGIVIVFGDNVQGSGVPERPLVVQLRKRALGGTTTNNTTGGCWCGRSTGVLGSRCDHFGALVLVGMMAFRG